MESTLKSWPLHPFCDLELFIRAIGFRIKRSIFSAPKAMMGKGMPKVRKLMDMTGGRLPDEEFYFDQMTRGLNLERVGMGSATMDDIKSKVEGERKRMAGLLSQFIRDKDAISKEVSAIEVQESPARNIYLMQGTPRAIICEVGEGRLVYLTDDKAAALKIESLILKEFKKTSRRFRFTGYVLDGFMTADSIVQSYLENTKEVIRASIGKSKSNFEKEIQARIAEVTDCFVPNLTIQMKGAGGTEELDALVVLGPDQVFDIEATDYSAVTKQIEKNKKTLPFLKQTLKTVVLGRCQEKALKANAMGVVVAKGFPKAVLLGLKDSTEDMAVFLTEESDFQRELEDVLVFSTLRKTTLRIPTRSPEEFARAMRQGTFARSQQKPSERYSKSPNGLEPD